MKMNIRLNTSYFQSGLGVFMSDIFDDVEKMLSEEKVSDEATASTSENTVESQSFNESELEDIMAEIESLESDFETSEVEAEKVELKVNSLEVGKTDLQKEIENEIEASLASVESIEEVETFSEAELEEINTDIENVIPFQKQEPVSVTQVAPVSFSANGMMNLSLCFNVGSETAKLEIDQSGNLVIKMSGVELCISEKIGCTVKMENGVNFNIPLTNAGATSTKKAA